MTKKYKEHFDKPYVIRVNKARRFWATISLVLLIVALPIGTYYGTLYFDGRQSSQLSLQLLERDEQISLLEKELDNFKQLHSNSELSAEVDRNSLEFLRKEMVSSEAKVELLGEQIRFYQSLMNPDPNQGGVYVESLDIKPTSNELEYTYSLIVAQRSAEHARLRGTADLEFLPGAEFTNILSHSLSELSPETAPIQLGFKFYQRLDGIFVLPEGFMPDKVRARVQIVGSGAQVVEQDYDWVSSSE